MGAYTGRMTYLRMPRVDSGGAALLGCFVLLGSSCMLPPQRASHRPEPVGETQRAESDPMPRGGAAEAAKRAAKEASAAEIAGRAGVGEAEASEADATQDPELSKDELLAEARRVLDEWHAAAAVGDKAQYIKAFALDAAYLGPDANERSDLATYTTQVEAAFRQWGGWTFTPFNRYLAIGPQSQIAWFDEEIESGTYSRLRGTGVLRRDGNTWKIVHYSLTYTVSEQVAREVIQAERQRQR